MKKVKHELDALNDQLDTEAAEYAFEEMMSGDMAGAFKALSADAIETITDCLWAHYELRDADYCEAGRVFISAMVDAIVESEDFASHEESFHESMQGN